MKKNNFLVKASLVMALALLSACGGGGGGGGSPAVDSSDIVRYPYETVFGDVCRSSSEPTPGCTFVRATGQRVTVSADPAYNSAGFGSDDMWRVEFDSLGNATVYDEFNNNISDPLSAFYNPTYANRRASDFAGHISGTTIGVGVTGAFWEDVRNGTYWFGTNGVLYSANLGEVNYGQAINNKEATKVADSDSFALKSQENVKLIKAGADKLMKEYGLASSKAVAVASALNSWAVMGAERGKVTETDMDVTFKTVFGVQFNEAVAAFKSFEKNDKAPARELVNRSASALGLKPEQAEDFIKGMYRDALASKFNVDVDKLNW